MSPARQSCGGGFNGQVISAVGRRLAEAEDTRFDLRSALTALRWVRAEDVPQIQPPFPPGVSDVRFVSNLDTAILAADDDFDQAKLWRVFRPR